MFNGTVDVIIRSFKTGISKPGIGPLVLTLPPDFEAYRQELTKVVSDISACPQVRTVYVVTNGDPNSPLAELPYPDGNTPTTSIINNENFHNVKTLTCSDWGSCNAINGALKAIAEDTAPTPRWVLVLSKEIRLNAQHLHEAVTASDRYNLFACGFYREGHWQRLPYGVPQNTSCLWDYTMLIANGGFDRRCEGKPGEYLGINGKKIPLAGMEDFHTQLRILKTYGFIKRWGMVLNEEPLLWDLSRKSPDEMQMHIQKICRQEAVMKRWAEELFPEFDWPTVMSKFFCCRISR